MSEVRLKMTSLLDIAKVRQPGYLDALISAGQMIDKNGHPVTDRNEAEILILPGTVYADFRANPPGLGDKVATVVKPIAKAADFALGTHYATCGACQQAQADLNRALPQQPFRSESSNHLEVIKKVLKVVLRRLKTALKLPH